MKIVKVLNNNLIYARDKKGRYVIIMGRGIGFYGKAGQMADEERIEQIIPVDNQKGAHTLASQLKDIPDILFELTNEILEYASGKIEGELNKNVYLTLADHINFSLIRHKRGLDFPNPLLWEIKKFYPVEYEIGNYAVCRINDRCQSLLGKDEAAFIALHIVCARYGSDMPEAMDATRLVSQIIEIVQNHYDTSIEEDSYKFQRFLTHLRFLAGRIVSNEQWPMSDEMDDTFVSMVKNSYKLDFNCALKVDLLFEKKYNCRMNEIERAYLTVHLRNMRVGSKNFNKKE